MLGSSDDEKIIRYRDGSKTKSAKHGQKRNGVIEPGNPKNRPDGRAVNAFTFFARGLGLIPKLV